MEAKMFLSNLTDQGVFFSTVELRYNESSGNEVLGKRMIIILRCSNSKIIIWKRPLIYRGLVLANILFLPVPQPFTKYKVAYNPNTFFVNWKQRTAGKAVEDALQYIIMYVAGV